MSKNKLNTEPNSEWKYKFSRPTFRRTRDNTLKVKLGDDNTFLMLNENNDFLGFFGKPTNEEMDANVNLWCLAPTLHEVVTKCQAILSNYLEPEGKSKEDVIKEFLDILVNKELIIKLKELEV